MRFILTSAFAIVACCGILQPARAAKAYLLEYVDPKTKKVTKLTRVPILEESPAGIVIEPRRGQKLSIPAMSINLLRYEPSTLNYLDFSKPFNPADRAKTTTDKKMREAQLKEAVTGLKDHVDNAQLKAESEVYRHVKYRLADTLYEWSKDDPAQRPQAIAALKEFQKDYSGGWQITSALQKLAELQSESGDQAEVLKTYKALAEVNGLSKELRWDALFSVARLLMRTNQFSEARDALNKLSTELPGTSPEKDRARLYLAQCTIAEGGGGIDQAAQSVQKLLGELKDDSLKALAHNTLADFQRQKKQPELAFWEYLRAHVMYPEDRLQHAKALYYLSKLFETVKQDAIRAQECRDLLEKKEYEGLIYQKMLLNEK